MDHFLAARHYYIGGDAKVFVDNDADTVGDLRHLNVDYLPNDVLSATKFGYLTLDGSDNAESYTNIP